MFGFFITAALMFVSAITGFLVGYCIKNEVQNDYLKGKTSHDKHYNNR